MLPRLRVATGAVTVRFTAPAGHALDRLVFRLWPNGPRTAKAGAHLSVTRVREHGRALATTSPDPTTLVVDRPLRAGERATISMAWRLVLPRQPGLRLKGGGVSVRLGTFFPILDWDGSGWPLDRPTKLRAEAWTTVTADFDVRVTHPPHLDVLASGAQVAPGRWRAIAVRDFALALGDFAVARGIAHVPAPVRVTVGVSHTANAAPARAFLRSAIASLQRYSALYGAYSWPTYTVAAMGASGGYEYPTLVYQPAANANVAHETAHQWFYSLVGNDQARDPWLDEGLATWAEARKNGAPPFADAEIPPEVVNRIGEPMTFWDRYDYRRFFLGAYLQTYRALASLGPQEEVDCALRRYVVQNAYGVARPRDLLNALLPAFPDAQSKLTAYGAHF